MKSMIADFKQSMRKLRTKPGEVFCRVGSIKQGLALGKVWEKYTTEFTKSTNWIKLSGTLSKTMVFSMFPSVARAAAPQDQRISRAWNLVCCCQGFQMSSSSWAEDMWLCTCEIITQNSREQINRTDQSKSNWPDQSTRSMSSESSGATKPGPGEGDKQKMTKGTVKCQSPVRPTFFLRPVNILSPAASPCVLCLCGQCLVVTPLDTAWTTMISTLTQTLKIVSKFHAFALQAASSSW